MRGFAGDCAVPEHRTAVPRMLLAPSPPENIEFYWLAFLLSLQGLVVFRFTTNSAGGESATQAPALFAMTFVHVLLLAASSTARYCRLHTPAFRKEGRHRRLQRCGAIRLVAATDLTNAPGRIVRRRLIPGNNRRVLAFRYVLSPSLVARLSLLWSRPHLTSL